MSLECYAKYIAQKFTLAAAIAVLKTKPDGQTVQKYIEYLKRTVNDENMNSDLDISICSDDFDMFDDNDGITRYNDNDFNDTIENGDLNDSVTILDDYRMDIGFSKENNEVSSILNVFKETNNVTLENLPQSQNQNISKHDVAESYRSDVKYYQSNAHSSDNLPKAAIYSEKHPNLASNSLVKDNYNRTNSTKLNKLGNNNFKIDKNCNIRAIISKNIDKEFGNAQKAETYQVITNKNTLNDNGSLYMIIDGTAYESIADKASESIDTNKPVIKSNALIDSQDTNKNDNLYNMVIDDMASKSTADKAIASNESIIKSNAVIDSQKTQGFTDNNTNVNQSQAAVVIPNTNRYIIKEGITTKSIANSESNKAKDANCNNYIITSNKPIELTNSFDSQETQCYTPNTHISQSQVAMNISKNYIYGVKENITSKNANKNNFEAKAVEFGHEMNKQDRKTCNIERVGVNFNDTENVIDNNIINIDLETNSVDSESDFKAKDSTNPSNIERIDVNSSAKATVIDNINQLGIPNISQEYNEYEDSNIMDDLTTSQKELIPFKIIEELNKMKGYLRKSRRVSSDGFSSDSGYRSDSQNRSRNALQLSGAASNQSAHSLYIFLATCPLVVRTHNISDEISKVLGQLIDSLHEEEKYPPFLEELLENVEVLIKRIYDEDTNNENQLVTKDEYVQRILLLNKSIHIQKFTIDKLTNILQEFLDEMMKYEEDFEINNISRIENLTYIFLLLETIVKRYLKTKDKLSQSTILSVEEVNLKKSTITDIWRKKWNNNYKSCSIEGSSEICVLVKCSEVLNKLIVSGLDNFSLIAYASLQCFNSIQN